MKSFLPHLTLLFLIVVFCPSAFAQEAALADTVSASDTTAVDSTTAAMVPAPVVNVAVKDTPNDAGGSLTVSWDESLEDYEAGRVTLYRVMRAEADIHGVPGEFTEVGDVPAGTDANQYLDGNTTDGVMYIYRIQAVKAFYNEAAELVEVSSDSEPTAPATSTEQWFDWRRINAFVGVIVLSFLIIFYISQAKAGKSLFIRRIAGMEAVDEAVGRATEMGKKVFYVPGISDMDNVQTIAAMNILGHVAGLTAQYDTYLDVPVSRSMVMVTGREVVKESYSKAGRPDAFSEDQVHYLTDDQFGYAAAIDGMVVREKPATIFYMGTFYAESLILAETGNSVGAIQIAGTAMPSQLPFFVAACDYTLIGEELFAASAYLSREPKLLGSLKGQDIGKGLMLILFAAGVVLETFGIFRLSDIFSVIR